MLQQASKPLFSRIALQHAAAASCTCLQQQQAGSILHAQQQQQQQSSYAGWSQHHQARCQSSSASTSAASAAAQAAQQSSSSGWSWFGSAGQQPAGSTAAAAAGGGDAGTEVTAVTAAADASDLSTAAAAAAGPPPADAIELISQADALVDASSAAADAMLAAAQASCWLGTRKFIDVMMWSHNAGFPWFEAIMVSNVLIKLAALPLTIFSQKNAPLMAAMRADTEVLKDLAGKMAKASTAGEYAAYAQEFQKARTEHSMKYGKKSKFVILTPFLMVGQMLVFLCQFSAISTLAYAKLPSMTYEGALWFTDLTVPDPIMLLPLLCAGMTVVQANSKRFQDVMMQANPQAGGPMKVLMTAMGGVVLVAGYCTPSALALLWATNSAFSIAQSGLLGSPVARKALGLPEAPTPAAPASGSSRGRSMFGQFFEAAAPTAEQQQQQQQPSKPLPAAAVGAPPPGTPIAVNYTTSKPSKRRAKF